MANNKPSLRTASGKVFWRLAPIILGIVAYFGLGAIESAKHSYDKERTAPIVVTDQTNIKEGVYEIGIGDLQTKLDNLQSKPELDAQGHVEPSSWEQLESYIRNIKFQRFKNEDELSEALNEQVLAEKAAGERKHQYRREGLNLSYAAERLSLFNERRKIEANIANLSPIAEGLKKRGDAKEKEPPCFEAASTAQPAATKTASNKGKILSPLPLCKQLQDWEALMTRIGESDAMYNAEQECINNELNDLDDIAQAKLKRVYLNLRPALAEIKSGNPVDKSAVPTDSQQPGSSRQQAHATPLKNYNFQSVLDDNNGIHVIYQVVRLILVVLLVFGIISVGLALLRLFPSYASSSEALTDKAKTFLSSNSDAAPSFARAAVISLAAIGIGTAVVVAGSPGGNSQPSVAFANDAGPVTQNNRHQTDQNGGTDTGDNIGRAIPMPYPVAYPSPLTLQPINNNIIPPLDEKKIESLSNKLEGLRGNIGDLQGQITTMGSDLSNNVKIPLSTLSGQVGSVNVPLLKNTTDTLSTDVSGLKSRADGLETTFFDKLNTVSGKLDTTNSTMTGIRNDSLAKLQRPEGRGLFTRLKQFFNTKETYFVSAQAYAVLENLLCTASTGDAAGNLPCANGALLTKLLNLKNDSAQQPRTERELLDYLGGGESSDVKPWKSTILRYTRLP